ncbi:MAG TPA: hypothetical protein VNO32_03985 [Candidatus Acidoferrum sp.]|nr:hypothetical protein [Candidatus Acidoferrum sp.]
MNDNSSQSPFRPRPNDAAAKTVRLNKALDSYDDGATWSAFDPVGKTLPRVPTVKAVYIGWEKKEE